MPLDPNIFSQLNTNAPAQIMGSYGNAFDAAQERQNKLAQLAQAQELQGVQLQQAKSQLAAQPQQAADAARQREAEYMRQISGEIANNPQNKDAILEKHAALAPQVGIDPSHITWLAQDLSTAQTPEELSKKAAYHSMTLQEQNKYREAEQAKAEAAKIAQTKWQDELAAKQEAARQAAIDKKDIAKMMLDGKRDNTLVQVVGADGVTPVLMPRSEAAGRTPYIKSASGAGSATQHISDAKESNALLDQVEQIAPRATSSGIGAARDYIGNIFGVSTDAADAAAQLDVLGASLTAKVPKMSGPQSDKDVAMYKAAAGNVADRTRPIPQRLAAIQTIREINNRQLGYKVGDTATPNQTGSVIKFDANGNMVK